MTTQAEAIAEGAADRIEVYEIDPHAVTLETVECPYCGTDNLAPGCIVAVHGNATMFRCGACQRGWTTTASRLRALGVQASAGPRCGALIDGVPV